jgi:hypothetical protein
MDLRQGPDTPETFCNGGISAVGRDLSAERKSTMPPREHRNSLITKGFWLAGAYNILGVLLFSKLFTNSLLTSLDPAVFSWLGLVAVMLWGCAYCSVARSYASVPSLLLVFVVEKTIYTTTWLMWLAKHGNTLPKLFSESPLTATFYTVYGAGDFAFGLFFLWVALTCRRHQRAAAAGLPVAVTAPASP